MRPVLLSIAIERTQPSLVRERIPESAFAQNGKSLYQTMERTLCWQAPASSLDIFFNQPEDRVELNPKTTAPWRILRSLA
jgi:hypothetical protein